MKMSEQDHETKHVLFTHHLADESIPPDVLVYSVPLEDSAQTVSTCRITFKHPPDALDRAELPKRTRGDHDEDFALLSAYHHDLEKVSEILKDGKGVFSGTGMLGMSDSAWGAINTKD